MGRRGPCPHPRAPARRVGEQTDLRAQNDGQAEGIEHIDLRDPGQSSLANPFGQLECLEDKEGVLSKTLDFSLLETAKRPNAFNDLDRDARFRIVPPRKTR